MLLAIDIGNTTTTCGLFKDGRLKKRFSFLTGQDAYFASLKKGIQGARVDSAIISSVVPKATTRLTIALLYLQVATVVTVGKSCHVPIKNRYKYPGQVGQDRLVNAYAAVKLYGKPAIVIDFGTAVTFDVISKKGEYLGGMIVPGLRLALESLHEKTALLPKITLRKPKELIGRTTADSMISGIVYGYAALTDDLIKRIRARIGKNAVTIATGGNCRLVADHCCHIRIIDPDLTLKGLALIHSR